MSDVPEHLLQRSRDRRAALGLGGGDAPAAAAPDAGTSVEPAAAAPAAAAPIAAAAPAEVEAAPVPVPPYVEAALKRKKIPIWAMSVLGLLPLWAILYAGSLSPSSTGELTQLQAGAAIYATNCATCHGGTGGGGVGRPLAEGEVLKTFPSIEAQMEFVALGTEGVGTGNPYGDPDRPGGQHIAGSFGVMPSFNKTLTPAQLLEVVRYERETLGGEEVPAEQLDSAENRLDAMGTPFLTTAGELVNADGEPLLDETGRLTIQIADGQPSL